MRAPTASRTIANNSADAQNDFIPWPLRGRQFYLQLRSAAREADCNGVSGLARLVDCSTITTLPLDDLKPEGLDLCNQLGDLPAIGLEGLDCRIFADYLPARAFFASEFAVFLCRRDKNITR